MYYMYRTIDSHLLDVRHITACISDIYIVCFTVLTWLQIRYPVCQHVQPSAYVCLRLYVCTCVIHRDIYIQDTCSFEFSTVHMRPANRCACIEYSQYLLSAFVALVLFHSVAFVMLRIHFMLYDWDCC